MPTLEWIGKDKVINHHLEVPFRVLDRKYSYDEKGQHAEDNGSENMIIKGDNLEALKALLPRYEGKVKCIYIDPPYNTGTEEWIYNDNVNDPKIRKWLGKVVGNDDEDLSRHDKWLCMMYPRLRLLQRLLSDDGIIFVSINDIEVSSLRFVLDEIFGRSRFIAQLIWKSRQNKDNRNKNNVSVDHEYVLCYGEKLRGCLRDIAQYSNPDNDPRGPWASANMVGLATEKERPNLHYDLINPVTGVNYGRPHKGWRYDQNTMGKLIRENRILWPETSKGRPRKKQFLKELNTDYTGFSSIIAPDFFTSNGTKEQLQIFGASKFSFPKCVGLLEGLIEQAAEQDTIILDSFAGTGTTAHAVLNMNKNTKGNRKFILVEMEDYAETITAERVKRVIQGYGDVPGAGGGFSFYELGKPLLIDGVNLNEDVGVEKIREYVWFMETKQPFAEPKKKDNSYLLGIHSGTAYYFYYEKEQVTTLDHDFLSTVKTKGSGYVIYADLNALSAHEMKKYGITFRKIPRDIAKL